jgi:hypothetical protein
MDTARPQPAEPAFAKMVEQVGGQASH